MCELGAAGVSSLCRSKERALVLQGLGRQGCCEEGQRLFAVVVVCAVWMCL